MRVSRHERGEIGKRRMEERKPHFVGKALATRFDGRLIAVEREHATFPTQGLEKACRVPAAPERRIDIEPIRCGGERCKRFIDKHRSVLIHKSPYAEAV